LESSELRKAGLKVTLPRVKILDILETSDSRHHSAEDVYKALIETGEDIGLATVYRVLTQFEAAGLVKRHHFEGGHHDHILCVKCGRVDEFVDEVIEKHQRAIAADLGYEMTDHCLYMYGICSACRDKS
jgi:Fur family ferric uptake transcriptional regulator